MTSEAVVRVAVVVGASSEVDGTLARIDDEFDADRVALTVVCPGASVSNRVHVALAERELVASVRVLERFSPHRIAETIAAAGVDLAYVDSRVPFPVSTLRSRLAAIPIEVRSGGRPTPGEGGSATPDRRPRRRRLRRPTGWGQRATLFALAFGFYLLLGEVTAYDLVTGPVSAAVVVLLLSRITFTESLTVRRTLPRVARAVAFVPYLLWKILRANLALAVVLLDPRLPIDPSVEEIDAEAESDLERAVLANSITLTPGTLTVDVRDSTLVVHALTDASREGLRDGTLQRAVRFVFGGGGTDSGMGADE